MKEELVSIIMPLYNKEKYIEKTLKSVIAQTYKNWELIIVDDASTDKSRTICNKYVDERIKIISAKKNNGPAIARNIGIDLIKGRYIAFIDADDMWDKDKLKKQIKLMEEHKYAFTYCQFRYIDENDNSKGNKIKVQKKTNYKEGLKNIRILTSTVIIDVNSIRKELIKMPSVLSEDVATWWQILKEGYEAYGLQECLVYYRVSKESLTANKFYSAKNRWNLYRNFEKLSLIKSIFYFVHYSWNGIVKRI